MLLSLQHIIQSIKLMYDNNRSLNQFFNLTHLLEIPVNNTSFNIKYQPFVVTIDNQSLADISIAIFWYLDSQNMLKYSKI